MRWPGGSKTARTGRRARPAAGSRNRSAAAAQQPPLGLHPGRAAPADGRPTGLRVRPRVRAWLWSAERCPGCARRRSALPVPRGVPYAAVAAAPSSTRRTTTRRSSPTASRCSTPFKRRPPAPGRKGPTTNTATFPGRPDTEMLLEQWLLARPELREFLPTRVMVAYPEPWMDRVDAMKSCSGLDRHVRALLPRPRRCSANSSCCRSGSAIGATVFDRNQAGNWARYWRQEAQGTSTPIRR